MNRTKTVMNGVISITKISGTSPSRFEPWVCFDNIILLVYKEVEFNFMTCPTLGSKPLLFLSIFS